MKIHIYILAIVATLSMSSCPDNKSYFPEYPTSRSGEGVGALTIAYATYRFVDCMVNTSLHTLSESEYLEILAEYQWLTEFENVVLEITPD